MPARRTTADVASHLSNDAGGNAVLDLGDGMSITFAGLDMSSLSESNFVFDQVPVTHNSGNMVLGNGSILPLSGVVENSGTITLDSTGSPHGATNRTAWAHAARRRLAVALRQQRKHRNGHEL